MKTQQTDVNVMKELPEWTTGCQRGDKSTKNLKVIFRIRMTSNRGHYFWKVTPNLPMYRSNPADLCTKIFNGIYYLLIELAYWSREMVHYCQVVPYLTVPESQVRL